MVKSKVLVTQDPDQGVRPKGTQEEKAPLRKVPVPRVGYQVQVRHGRGGEVGYEAVEDHGWAFARARWRRRSALRERIS